MINALYMQHAFLNKVQYASIKHAMLLMQQTLSKLTATYSQLHASGITYRMLVCRLLRLCFKSVELCYAVRLACPRQVESVLQGDHDELENMLTQDLVSSSRHQRDLHSMHTHVITQRSRD